MKIAYSKTREQFPLSRKKIIKKTITKTIGAIVGMIIAFFMVFMFVIGQSEKISAPNWLGTLILGFIGFTVLVMILEYFYQRWYFAVYFYELGQDFIQIKKGPITPREITIPYERIQDVYVDQDIFDRMFGLYDVHLSSATISSGMEAHIDGVEKQAAEGLRNLLLETVKERISKNRQPNIQ
jgi:membrane protein YdbS with pleckstrin-like domain